MDQIDYYKNVRTKLTVTPKYKDQNNVFAYKKCKSQDILQIFLQTNNTISSNW